MELASNYLNQQFKDTNPVENNKVARDITKSIKDLWLDKLKYIPLKPMALLQATEPGSDVLKSLSCSEPDDLLLDNFGVMLSSCINTGADVQRDVVDEVGVTRDIHWQENQNLRMAFATADGTPGQTPALSLGSVVEIGFGDSMGNPWNPQRSDFQLRQRFVVVPQSLFQNVSTPEWVSANQEVMFSSQVNSVVGNFIVGECGAFTLYRVGFGTGSALIMLSHDKTGLMVADGDNIKTTYTWSLS